MEAFSLLKFWRNAGGGGDDGGYSDTDVTNGSDDEDSFFDLEFKLPDSDEKEENKAKNVDTNKFDDDNEDHYKDSARKSGESRSSFVESPISKSQSPISLLRSPQKLRVLMQGFKKSKLERTWSNGGDSMASPKKSPEKQGQSKRFTVKCEVEEVPIISLFTRENSLRSRILKQSSNDSSKRFAKDVVQKYLNLIKPLYVRVSKRYGDKMNFSESFSKTTTPSSSPATAPICSPRKQVDGKQFGRPAALRVVCKHLGKSRSASSAAGVVPSPVSRRDDSLLQQNDGIQSAILHCKRSFNSSTESSVLSRSATDTYREKSIRHCSSKFSEELKRCSI